MVEIDIEKKECTHCGDILPRSKEWFEKRDTKHALDGLSSWCKPCINSARRERWRKKKAVEPIEIGEKQCRECQKILPKTHEYFHFSRKHYKDGFNSACRQCVSAYESRSLHQRPRIVEAMKLRDIETRLGVYTNKWTRTWKDLPEKDVRAQMQSAKAYAYSIGCDWLADDAAQIAAIEYLQKGYCSYRFAVLKLIDQTIGSPESVRRKYNAEIDQKILEDLYAKISEEIELEGIKESV